MGLCLFEFVHANGNKAYGGRWCTAVPGILQLANLKTYCFRGTWAKITVVCTRLTLPSWFRLNMVELIALYFTLIHDTTPTQFYNTSHIFPNFP